MEFNINESDASKLVNACRNLRNAWNNVINASPSEEVKAVEQLIRSGKTIADIVDEMPDDAVVEDDGESVPLI